MFRRTSSQRGQFLIGLLIFLLIIIIIIGILAAIMVPALAQARIKAMQTKAKTDMHSLDMAAKMFYMETRKMPDSLRDLVRRPKGATRWNGPYVDKMPVDPWKRPYIYRKTSGNKYQIMTYGADGRPGGTGANMDLVHSK